MPITGMTAECKGCRTETTIPTLRYSTYRRRLSKAGWLERVGAGGYVLWFCPACVGRGKVWGHAK